MRRERIAYAILIGIMVLLFAITFAVLGRGEYDPPGSHGSATPAEGSALVASASY
jgi:hypothetical protein